MAIAAAAIGVGGSLLSSRSGSKDASKLQRRAINASQPLDTNLNVAGVGDFNISGGRDNISISQGDSPFTDLSNQFLNQAGTSLAGAGTPLFDVAQTGFSPELLAGNQQAIADQFNALTGAIGQQSTFDPNAFAATQFDRLNSLAARGEEIAANRVANSLFSRGRLGADDSASGEAFAGLARGQEDARTARALQAITLAGNEQDRIFGQQQQQIQNQFGVLGQLFAQQQQGVGGFLDLQSFIRGDQQQQLQNALGFSQGANAALDPNFRGLELALQARLGDQGNRVSAATGSAGAAANIIGQRGAAQQQAIGNIFASLAENI